LAHLQIETTFSTVGVGRNWLCGAEVVEPIVLNWRLIFDDSRRLGIFPIFEESSRIGTVYAHTTIINMENKNTQLKYILKLNTI